MGSRWVGCLAFLFSELPIFARLPLNPFAEGILTAFSNKSEYSSDKHRDQSDGNYKSEKLLNKWSKRVIHDGLIWI